LHTSGRIDCVLPIGNLLLAKVLSDLEENRFGGEDLGDVLHRSR